MSITVDSPRRHRQRAPVSLTASYTSTVAEELVMLLRKLHTLDTWNTCINEKIVKHLGPVPQLLLEQNVVKVIAANKLTKEATLIPVQVPVEYPESRHQD